MFNHTNKDVLFPTLLGTFQGKYFMTSHHIVTLYITDICLFELLGLLEMLSLIEVHVLLEMLYLIEVLCLLEELVLIEVLCLLEGLLLLDILNLSELLCLPEVLAYLVLTFLSNFSHHCTEFLYVFICFKVHYRWVSFSKENSWNITSFFTLLTAQ